MRSPALFQHGLPALSAKGPEGWYGDNSVLYYVPIWSYFVRELRITHLTGIPLNKLAELQKPSKALGSR